MPQKTATTVYVVLLFQSAVTYPVAKRATHFVSVCTDSGHNTVWSTDG